MKQDPRGIDRPRRLRKPVMKGYEFEVEGRVLASKTPKAGNGHGHALPASHAASYDSEYTSQWRSESARDSSPSTRTSDIKTDRAEPAPTTEYDTQPSTPGTHTKDNHLEMYLGENAFSLRKDRHPSIASVSSISSLTSLSLDDGSSCNPSENLSLRDGPDTGRQLDLPDPRPGCEDEDDIEIAEEDVILDDIPGLGPDNMAPPDPFTLHPSSGDKAPVPGMEPIPAAEAEAMLPDPLFHHFEFIAQYKYWTADDEQRLQIEYGDWAKQMDEGCRESSCERGFWRLTIKLFGCHPFDLFRYGLQMERTYSSGTVIINGKAEKSVNFEQAFCTEIQGLLCHPLWDGKIELLRYALQLTIYYRVKDHILPLGPGIDMKQDPTDDVWRAIREVEDQEEQMSMIGDYCYETYLQNGPPGHRDIRDLAARLQKTLTPVPAQDPDDRLLFKLRLSDLTTLKTALDGTTTRFGAPRWSSCTDYWRQYRRARTEAWLYPPTTARQLSAWKQKWFLHSKREGLIRLRFRELGAGDMLLDIPRRDPVPFYFNSRRVSQEQRDVLYGAVGQAPDESLPALTARQVEMA